MFDGIKNLVKRLVLMIGLCYDEYIGSKRKKFHLIIKLVFTHNYLSTWSNFIKIYNLVIYKRLLISPYFVQKIVFPPDS